MSKKTRGPSEADAADGPVGLTEILPEVPPPVVLREFVVRFTSPHAPPISFSVRCATIEEAQATFLLTVKEMNPGPPPVPKPPKRFVTIVAARTAEYAGRKLTIPVFAEDDAAAIEIAKRDAVEKFMFPKGSVTEVASGSVVWKARVMEAAEG